MKDNIVKPPSWIEGYCREVLLGGKSILPYICEEDIYINKENKSNENKNRNNI